MQVLSERITSQTFPLVISMLFCLSWRFFEGFFPAGVFFCKRHVFFSAGFFFPGKGGPPFPKFSVIHLHGPQLCVTPNIVDF